MSRANILVVCPDCEQPRLIRREHMLRYGYTGRCQVCNGLSKHGQNHPQWKGGVTHRGDGYIERLVSSDSPFCSMAHVTGRAMEHRLVMAEQEDRCLRKDETVHHLNGNRSDNRKENLCITTNKEHDKRSLIKQLQERICVLEREVK